MDSQMDTCYAVLGTYGADLAAASCRDAEVPSVPGFGGDERLADGPRRGSNAECRLGQDRTGRLFRLRARKGRKRRGDG